MEDPKHGCDDEELQKSHQLLLDAESIGQIGSWEIDLETGQVVTTEGNRRLFFGDDMARGVRFEEYAEAIHPEDRKWVLDRREELLSGTGSPDIEYRIVLPDGAVRVIRGLQRVVRDASGKAVRAFGTNIDLTELKRLQKSLEEEKELLLAVINSLPDLVFVKDRESRFMLVNRSLAQFLGASDPKDVVGKSDLDFVPSELADKHAADDRQVLETAQSLVDAEELFTSSQGSFRWILTTKVPLLDKGGMVTGLVGIGRDITERKHAQQKQQEQAALLDITTDAILMCDLRNRITFWNKSAAKIFGWSWEEAQGRDAIELLFSPEHAVEPVKATAIVMEEGGWSGDLHPRTKDGRELIVESRYTLVKDPRGSPSGVLCVNSDVSERRSIQSQLLRAQRLESIGTLAGGIAHDLNNVLAPILMGVEGLSLQQDDERSRAILNIIRTAAQRGASIVRQVLGFARGVEGQRSEVQLKHLLREVEQIVQETFPKSIEVKEQVPKDLPPIIADATQIHQVLMNLCVNARDAMPDGGTLTLSAETVRLDNTYARMNTKAKPIEYVVLKVEDTGTGMPPSVLAKIFDPFFTTKDPGKGTGLGLSVTHTIVESHGGFIKVYSEIGRGSSFRVYLPAAVQTVGQETDAPAKIIPMGEGERILVVDDETAVREIAKQILESYDYDVATASDGAEAIAIFAQGKEEIRAVITDMLMPTMDGLATVRALRRISPEVKIIVTSGLVMDEQSKAVSDLGIQAFLAKPYTAEVLLETLKRVLESSPRPSRS
jgi:PAS domain S-box-containing protein